MRCFTGCFAAWKQKEIKKNVQEPGLSPRYERVEAVKLLADTSELLKEDEVVNTISESQAKTQEPTKRSNENEPVSDHPNTETDPNELISKKNEPSAFDHPNMKTNTNELSSNENEPAFVHPNTETDVNELSSNFNNSHENGTREEGKDDKESVAMKTNESNSDNSCPLEESSESLFSLSLDSRKQVYAAENGDKEVNSNPMQQTEIKSLLEYDDDEDKENVKIDENRNLSRKEPIKKTRDSEILCDTSLSSWLVESEKSSQKGSGDGNSPESEKNYGERGVLGAISGGSMLECSGDEQPSIGTVGRYWMARRWTDVGGGMSSVSTKVV